MGRRISCAAAFFVAIAASAPASAQTDELQLKEARYQIGQIERLLEGAVEFAATVFRDRLHALMPADMLLTESARARGFRLDGYGVFFDVEVPSLQGTLAWSFRTLDQNALGLDSALRTLRTFIEQSATNDVNLEQALRRIELQVGPVGPPAGDLLPSVAGARTVAGTAASLPDQPPTNQPDAATSAARETILDDPNEAWRVQVRDALMDTMLEHSRGLSIGGTEMLTVAARGINEGPRLGPADTEARTVVITVRGADLTAFLAGQISRDEARKRVEVRVF
jgi:hypothetical protein